MADMNCLRTSGLIAAVACGLTAIPALAAQAPDGPASGEQASAEQIVVTGRGLEAAPGTPAYSTTLIGREAITTSASGRIEDVLSQVAGFQQFRRSDSRSSNPSAQGVTLRALGGNATSRALVLLDGVPMADPFFGYIPLSALAPDTLAAIRVTRGGGSGPFGAGALSGTIELESAGPDQLGLVVGQLLASQRGETEAALSIAPRLGAGFAVVSGRWDRGQGFWTTPVAQRVPASVRARYESWSTAIRAVAPLSDTVELQAKALVYRDDRVLRFRGATTSSEGQDASLRLVGRGDWQFDALAYVQARNFDNIVVSATSFRPTLDQYATPAQGLGGKFELRPPTGANNVLRLGVDWRRASGTMKENALNATTGAVTARRRAGGVNTDLGFYAENDLTLGKLVLTGGLRADRTVIDDGYFEVRNAAGAVTSLTTYATQTDWTVTWRGGAVWRAADAIALRAAAYTGLRQPTLNELYRPFTVFPVVTQANAQLRNETLEGFEAGVDFTPREGLRLSLTGFDNRIKDAIANVTIGTNQRQRRNVAQIRARGIEASGHVEVGIVRFDGSLAWTDAEVRNGAASELTGKRPAQTPRLAASGTLALTPAQGWQVAATLRHVGLQFEDDVERDSLPAATTVDLFAQMPLIAGASFVLRGENLFDVEIVTRNSGGSIDLGNPRTVWAGVRFAF
ncbi:MAG: TonB-dependent receptor [Novosphingobium sp. 28-62-57]|uniref:TonB-dependent receptor n=1 Tax=unclassified Novosphingobium TaxID=2644732 RepID=UPI000BD5B03A|nr:MULTISPECIES: TonB-dependent receptor [unclassified Novosphingobium]OYW48943.1 MAG: TonB-dependent receptor [Novosphingobium sp. 12-62-10]OYZ09592.1 MAG: TonB-dependent receptor [Novosphingobium sp. 28-62-57]OZA34327.1 MAG: TonB-dependent receptor [Novosphingobium sp. 17-62-9]HQS68617.1 TonB-dependent receptor [Novosphingobium sp.]